MSLKKRVIASICLSLGLVTISAGVQAQSQDRNHGVHYSAEYTPGSEDERSIMGGNFWDSGCTPPGHASHHWGWDGVWTWPWQTAKRDHWSRYEHPCKDHQAILTFHGQKHRSECAVGGKRAFIKRRTNKRTHVRYGYETACR